MLSKVVQAAGLPVRTLALDSVSAYTSDHVVKALGTAQLVNRTAVLVVSPDRFARKRSLRLEGLKFLSGNNSVLISLFWPGGSATEIGQSEIALQSDPAILAPYLARVDQVGCRGLPFLSPSTISADPSDAANSIWRQRICLSESAIEAIQEGRIPHPIREKLYADVFPPAAPSGDNLDRDKVKTLLAKYVAQEFPSLPSDIFIWSGKDAWICACAGQHQCGMDSCVCDCTFCWDQQTRECPTANNINCPTSCNCTCRKHRHIATAAPTVVEAALAPNNAHEKRAEVDGGDDGQEEDGDDGGDDNGSSQSSEEKIVTVSSNESFIDF